MRRFVTCGALVAASVLAYAALPVGSSPAQGNRRQPAAPRVGRMTPGSEMGPPIRPAGISQSGLFACQKGGPFPCYGPAQIRTAYSITPLLSVGDDGRGQTIVIIDAFQDPTIASDLAAFDSQFKLPAPPSFTTVAPEGVTPFDANDPNQVGWSSEIAIDVEWAHAVAPKANLVLALSTSDADPDLLKVEQYIVSHRVGDIVSMSYGEAEACMDPTILSTQHDLFAAATAKGMTMLAASGDSGAALPTCDNTGLMLAVSTPASDPDVTAVGGTTLYADLRTGLYFRETVWNEPDVPGAGGGGYSTEYPVPEYQRTVVDSTTRAVPDVSLNASVDRGEIIAWGSSGQGDEFWVFGGTSIAAPQWAGIVALANQLGRTGPINAQLYRLGAGYRGVYHDITTGNNSFPPVTGYKATRGWDPATGWGTPVVSALVPALQIVSASPSVGPN